MAADPFRELAHCVFGPPQPAPSAPPAFRDRAEAMAAIEPFLAAGAHILARCRVEHERVYLRDTLAEFASLALIEWHNYQGDDDWERGEFRAWAERAIAQAEGRA